MTARPIVICYLETMGLQAIHRSFSFSGIIYNFYKNST